METKVDKRVEHIVRSHYEPRLEKYSQGYQILDWESHESQLKRFQVLADKIPLHGKSLLDVGCGVGDLFAFFQERAIDVRYTGVDLLARMVAKAQEAYPEGTFLKADIFSHSPFSDKSFEVVYCSGIFNLNMGDNRTLLKEAIPIFFRHSTEWVVFNLLDPDHYVKDSKYCFFQPQEVIPWIEPFSSHIDVITGYVPNDFTVVARV